MYKNKLKILVTVLAMLAGICTVAAQSEPIIVEPLFEYPMAPDELDGLQARSNWLVEHFWDNMNFKDKSSVNQSALNHAFNVYVTPMRFAAEDASEASVQKLISRISKNPVLSLQFAKAAEEALYGPRAEVWNDAIVIRFFDNVINNKSIKKDRKVRYERIRHQLANTQRGTVPPEFDYITPDGKKSHYHPDGVITIIEFGDPGCDDCRMAKLKMDTNVQLGNLIEKGMVNVLFVVTDPEEGWQKELSGYPAKWYVGASDTVSDIYDIRRIPTLYVIDREGKVAAKNVDVQTAMSIAISAAQQ